MTQDEAVAKAQMIAQQEGWTWREPVRVDLEHVSDSDTIFSEVFGRLSRSLGMSSGSKGGRKVWKVFSNAGARGANVVVALDDETGEVLQKAFWPR